MNSIQRASSLFFSALTLLTLFSGCKEKDTSMILNEPRNIRGVVSYKRSFGDLHDLHTQAARKIGVRGVASRQEAEHLKSKLVEVKTNPLYTVDELTHSIPFLVPKAHTLLESIGSNFLDSLKNKGLNPNQIRVTSVLRTREDIKDLRKRNTNASSTSVHVHGTTFDVSYKRFVPIEHPEGRPYESVGSDTLKLVLAEVLRDLKKAEMCYVKYELKQGCFHITAR
ncbi:MAG: DUF5715 family protein [Phocaeicola sp.]